MDKTEIATGLGRRTRYIEKWDQTGSPKFPDRGEISEIPGLPSGVNTIPDRGEISEIPGLPSC